MTLAATDTDRLEALREQGVRTLRVVYSDLHGIQRGKDVPLAEAERVLGSGVAFCAATMTTDLAHTPVAGQEVGYTDFVARPDLSTAVTLPWAPDVAHVLADLVDPATGGPHPLDPRGALRRAVADCAARDLEPLVAPELEFFLLKREGADPTAWPRYVDTLSSVYTVGPLSDPRGISLAMLHACAELGLGAFAVNHEFMNSQYEINIAHGPALDAADRAFRLKNVVKEIAAHDGLHATFMGKPFNDQGGSGLHVHVSLAGRAGGNALADPDGRDGIVAEGWSFIAGVLEHAPALMAILAPTINAYRRIVPDSLAPTHASWGHDNRTTFVRIPVERGGATRIEVRAGDATANVHLVCAALLWAGLDGIARGLEAPEEIKGDAYAQSPGLRLPRTLDAALDALEADEHLVERLGPGLVDAFLVLKRSECERFGAWVTDWERREYLPHL